MDLAKSPESAANYKPSWRLAKIDMDGQWGFDKCCELIFIHEKLKNFESMTWAEIEGKKGKRGAKHNKLIPVCNICREAQNRLTDLQLEYDMIYSLHLAGLKRLWGIRDSEILSILWWDPEHTVYPVEKFS